MATTQRKPLLTLLMLTCIGILISAPLYLDTTRERDWGLGLLIILIGFSGVIWSLALFSQTRSQTLTRLAHFRWPITLLLMFQGWVALQLYLSITTDPAATVKSLFLGLAYTLFFCIVVSVFHTRKRISFLLIAIVISGTLQATYGSLMVLSGVEWLVLQAKQGMHGIATGTFYNRNHLAGHLEMALGLGIGLLLAMRGHTRMQTRDILALITSTTALLRICLIIMVIGLVMSRSRMGNTAFFASLIGAGLFFTWLDVANRRRNIIILTSILIIDVLVISQFFGLEKLVDRISSTQVTLNTLDSQLDASEPNTPVGSSEQLADLQRTLSIQREARDNIGEYAWQQFLLNPITGYGAGSFNTSYQQFPRDDAIQVDQAHNDHLQSLIEFGVIGYSILALLVMSTLWRIIRTIRADPTGFSAGVSMGALIAISSLSMHAFTDFNWQIPANSLLFVTCLAIGYASSAMTTQRIRTKKTHAR